MAFYFGTFYVSEPCILGEMGSDTAGEEQRVLQGFEGVASGGRFGGRALDVCCRNDKLPKKISRDTQVNLNNNSCMKLNQKFINIDLNLNLP